MRVMFTFAGDTGHFLPLLPTARAVADLGHEILFACREGSVGMVRAAGYPALGVESTPIFAGTIDRPLDLQTAARLTAIAFGERIAPHRAAGVRDAIRDWKPDLVVRDELDYGAAIAAEQAGVPQAGVVVMPAGGLVRADLLADKLDPLRAKFGLPSDPDLHALIGSTVIAPFAPSFRDPAYPLPPAALSVRAVDDAAGGTADLPGLPRLPDEDRPVVYLTLGTLFPRMVPGLLDRLVAGLRELDAELFVTVGRDGDPAGLGPQPANVHVHRFLPQGALLSRAALAVNHGGSGSVIGALAQGVPLLLTPIAADQPHNAARCVELGVGRSLAADTATPEEIFTAARELLDDDSAHAAAAGLAAENATLPSAAEALRHMPFVLAQHVGQQAG